MKRPATQWVQPGEVKLRVKHLRGEHNIYARIVSLADTHSMLTDDYWQTASLQKLLEAELSHYEIPGEPRISLHGPNVALVADIAIPVSMAFHELASNSAKFGALSRPQGRLEVQWGIPDSAGEQVLHLHWQERDGPIVQPPSQRGFGTTLLERVVTVQCNAKINCITIPACRLSSNARYQAAGSALPPRFDQPARPVQPTDPRVETVAAFSRGFHRIGATHRLFQRRPCQRYQERRQPTRPHQSGGDDGADAEHHRLSAGAEARCVRKARSRHGQRKELAGERVFMGKGRCSACHDPQTSFMDNNMHDLKLERFYKPRRTVNDMVELPDGPIKTFTLRGIKDTPPYLHDGRLMMLADTVEFFNLVLGVKLTQDEKDDLVAYMLAL